MEESIKDKADWFDLPSQAELPQATLCGVVWFGEEESQLWSQNKIQISSGAEIVQTVIGNMIFYFK